MLPPTPDAVSTRFPSVLKLANLTRSPCAVGCPVQFDKIGDAADAEPPGCERHGRHDPHAAPLLGADLRCRLVQHTPFGGEAVLRPRLFDMKQRTLARTEQMVLQRRERHEIGIRIS